MRKLLLLFLSGAAAAYNQQLQFKVVKEEILEQRLRLANPKNSERYRILKGLLAQAGCGDGVLREQRVRGSKEPNMICGVEGTGEAPRRILVGAHFDCAAGDGLIDNWSGAVLLPAYYQSMTPGGQRHAFEFVAFAGEEKGLLGSRAYLKSIPKSERNRIAAVVILDSLGLTPTKCWVNGSTKELVTSAIQVATALKLDFRGVNMEKVGTTDSEPFKDAHIPVLCLHSVTQETLNVVNGARDVWSAVSWKDYYESHRFIAALLNYLDQTLE